MSREATARRTYEDRVVGECLAALAKRTDLARTPLTEEELKTLAIRAREAFKGGDRRNARFVKYRDHLASLYGTEAIGRLAADLETINNGIGYQEK
jgi:hypothetical protein